MPTKSLQAKLAAGTCALAALAATGMADSSQAEAARATELTPLYAGPAANIPQWLTSWGVSKNAYLNVSCWYDYGWAYGTNRWFYVSATGWNMRTGRSGPVSGWISANRVKEQPAVRRC